MILSFCGISLAASLFFSGAETNNETTKVNTEKSGYYTTEWEEVSMWNRSESGKEVVYHFNRSTAEWDHKVSATGTVVVFVKGYDFSGFSKLEKPLSLPFYFMAPDENSGTWNWNTEVTEGNVNVALQMANGMEENFLKTNNNIRLRYFVISQELMKKHKLTPQALRGMSYAKITSLLGLAPQV